MSPQDAQQLRFDFFPDWPVVVQPHRGAISSDAGLLAIRQADARLRYTQRLAACLTERRLAPTHTLVEMVRQRLYGILADYEDCNDHDRLRDDPIFKLVAGRAPDAASLASQPTLSRFENAVEPAALQRLIAFQIASGVERLRVQHGGGLPATLTLDLDATDDPTHGQQQLAFYHGYYEQWQYFPLVISEPTTQHLFGTWLRPGTLHAACGAEDDLAQVVAALRAARPDLALHVRGDSGFGVPWMYAACEQQNLTYTFGLAANPRLQALAAPLREQARQQYARTGEPQRRFTHFSYQAESWARPRTVIAKAEWQAAGSNLRFVVTNRPVTSDADAQRLYDEYVQRGTSEQRLDELKNGLHGDRLSCHRFLANFWRLLLHATALNLLNWVRDDPHVPAELRTARPATWRSKLLKVAALVVQSTRRVLVQLTAPWPFWNHYVAVGQRVLLMPAGP